MTINWTSWKEPLRDAAIIFALTIVGGFVLGFSAIKVIPENAIIYSAMTMFMGILAFTIIGCTTKHRRVEYLPAVAFVLWLLNLINVPLGFLTFGGWIYTIIGIAIWALIGGALSFIFVRNNPPSPVEPARSE
jgi:hypothetical protein